MPDDSNTTKIPAANPIEVAIARLTRLVESKDEKLTKLVEDQFHEMGVRVGLVSSDLGVLKQRVSTIESLRHADEQRFNKASGGVRELSVSDAGQDVQIAALSVKVDALATATDQQSRRWGIGLGALKWLAGTDGRSTVMSIISLVGIAYTALRAAGVVK